MHESTNSTEHDLLLPKSGKTPVSLMKGLYNYLKQKKSILPVCVAITVVIIAVVVMITAIAVASIVVAEDEEFGVKTQQVGGKVPVKIESSDFDSHKVARTEISINNAFSTSVPSVSAYFGSYDDLGDKSTKLEEKSSVVNLCSFFPQEINYYNDTPIYALAGTSLTYNVSVSTSSFEEFDISLYLFNTLDSYKQFLNGLNFTYYHKSHYNHSSSIASWTVNINETAFVFGGIVANVTAVANVTISGQRYEYDVSLLKKMTVYDSSEIKFCHHKPCFGLNGQRHCVLVKSDVLTNATYQNEGVDLELIKVLPPYGLGAIIVIVVAIVIIVLILSVCIYKMKKLAHSIQGETHNTVHSHSQLIASRSSKPIQEIEENPKESQSAHVPIQLVNNSDSGLGSERSSNQQSTQPSGPIDLSNPIASGVSTHVPEQTDVPPRYDTPDKQETNKQAGGQECVPNVTGNTGHCKPTVIELEQQLNNLVIWEPFALRLKGITEGNIGTIKRDNRDNDSQKRVLFDKWLRVDPKASWDHVVKALEGTGENTIAKDIQTKYLAHQQKDQNKSLEIN